MKFGYIPACNFKAFGDSIPNLLRSAVDHNYGAEALHDVMNKLIDGYLFLFAGVEGDEVKMLVALRVNQYVAKRALNLSYVAGKGAAKALFPYMLEAAKDMKCDLIEFTTHSRAARLAEKFGFDIDRHFCVLDLSTA